jgi:hypothetical protein
MTCIPMEFRRSFVGIYCFHFHGCLLIVARILVKLFFSSEDSCNVFLWCAFQNTEIFVAISVGVWNLTRLNKPFLKYIRWYILTWVGILTKKSPMKITLTYHVNLGKTLKLTKSQNSQWTGRHENFVSLEYILSTLCPQLGARGSIVVKTLMLQAEMSRVRDPIRCMNFFQFT